MSYVTTVRVRQRGQVTIPDDIRLELGINTGDMVQLTIEKVKDKNA